MYHHLAGGGGDVSPPGCWGGGDVLPARWWGWGCITSDHPAEGVGVEWTLYAVSMDCGSSGKDYEGKGKTRKTSPPQGVEIDQ